MSCRAYWSSSNPIFCRRDPYLSIHWDDGGVVVVATETPVGFHHTECVEDFCHFGVPIRVHRIAIRLVEVGYEDVVLGVVVVATEVVTTRAHPKAVTVNPCSQSSLG